LERDATLQVVDFVLKQHVFCLQIGKQALDVLKLKTTNLQFTEFILIGNFAGLQGVDFSFAPKG